MSKRRSQYPWYHKYIKSRIDETWGWCEERKKALKRASVGKDERGNEFWRCEECDAKPLKRDQRDVDHIVPRVNPQGWDGYDLYITRSFVLAENLKVLCKACHEKKTGMEAGVRAKARKAKKHVV